MFLGYSVNEQVDKVTSSFGDKDNWLRDFVRWCFHELRMDGPIYQVRSHIDIALWRKTRWNSDI